MKESYLVEFFAEAIFFLGLSALVIPVLRFFKVPVALGYLLAGVAIGPYALGAITVDIPALSILAFEDTTHVSMLAELGIVLLLFVIGMELTPKRLWQMRRLVFGLGGAQVITTALVIGGIAYAWGNNFSASVLIGLALALSSTALVTQWLHEQKLFATYAGRSTFSILLLQDLALIPILLLLEIMLSEGGGNIVQFVSTSLLKMTLAVAVIYIVGKMALKHVFVFANRYGGAEVFMALTLLTIVLSASAAAMAGLSMALGAFIAGLLLADTEYHHEIEALIVPFKNMLLGIFFFSFGMGINLGFIFEKPLWLFLSVIGLMSIKAMIVFGLCKLWRTPDAVAAESGILLSQAGEFGLLVMGAALFSGMMDESVAQFMLITIAVTMAVTPLITPFARKVGAMVEAHQNKKHDYAMQKAPDLSGHIVILGYGRIGSRIGDELCKDGWKIVGFEKSVDRVQAARSKSTPIFLGDASKKSSLKATNLDEAMCVVITLDDSKATKRIVKALREIKCSVPIVTRAHDAADFEMLDGLDNVTPIAEDMILSAEMSDKIAGICSVKAEPAT